MTSAIALETFETTEASFNQSSDNFTLAGHSFTSGNRITLFDSSNGIGQDYVIDTVSADNFTLQGSSINDALFVRDIAQKSLHGLDSGDVLTDNSQGVLLFVKKLDDDQNKAKMSYSCKRFFLRF